ncbi:MAG: PAS domain S-box protein [Candidatus Schekmanbacteria bacterium]|nr:PAS domain S-box protein [Candidatus Schekmanbacteria bacterium]
MTAKQDSFVMEIDSSGKVTDWSDLACQLFGYDKSDVLNSYLPLIPERIFHEFLDAKNKVLKGEQHALISTKRMLEDGAMVELNFLCNLLSLNHDRKNSIRFNLHSIKKLKSISADTQRQNESIVEQETNEPLNNGFKNLLHNQENDILINLPEAVVIIDTSGVIKFVNKCAESFTGYKHDELSGKNITFITEHTGFGGNGSFSFITKKTCPQSFRATILTRNGDSEVPVEILPVMNHSSSGAIEGYTLILKDISELLSKDELISYLRDYTDYTIESLDDALITSREDNTIMYWNRGAEEMFGYSSAEATGKNILTILLGNKYKDAESPSEKEGSKNPLIAYLANSSNETAKLSFEKKLVRRNGELFPALLSVSVPRNNKGESVVGNVILIKDITERKKLEQQLLHSEKLASLGSMISGITHELNNKLAPILGYAQLIKLMDIDGELSDMISKIEISAKSAKNIIHSLLGFARHNKPDFKPVDLNEILIRVVNLFKYKLDASNIILKTDLGKNIPKTMADENQIEQVFVNIINNSLQALETTDGVVDVTSRYINNSIFINISDTGPGIHEENLKRIFDPFFTTKEPSIGTGLGLSVCYGIINNHNGRITVESEPLKKTIFVIELPVKEIIQKNDDFSIELAKDKFKGSKKNILVIDDDPMIRDLMESVLKRNHHVDLANAGGEAMEMLEHKKYDLIISDLRMPGIDGFKLFQLLKDKSTGMEKKIIFTTGDTYDHKTKQFIEKTGSKCLAKPFNVEDLMEYINSFFSSNLSV